MNTGRQKIRNFNPTWLRPLIMDDFAVARDLRSFLDKLCTEQMSADALIEMPLSLIQSCLVSLETREKHESIGGHLVRVLKSLKILHGLGGWGLGLGHEPEPHLVCTVHTQSTSSGGGEIVKPSAWATRELR